MLNVIVIDMRWEALITENTQWRQFKHRYWPLAGYLLILMVSIWLVVPIIFHIFHVDSKAATDGLALGFNTHAVTGSPGWTEIWHLFLRNYGLAWFYIIVAFLPVPTYWLFAIINALTVGIVLSDPHPLLLFMVGILPHGVFEITAQLLTLCIAAHVTRTIQQCVKSLWQNDSQTPSVSVKPFIFDMITLIPVLYGIAAIIEIFVTPALFHTFMI